MLRKTFAAGGLAVALAALAAPASAAMWGDGLPDGAPLTQPAQLFLPNPFNLLFFGGHDWCWYDDAWNGPGWYWCGYGYRDGVGYGGPDGFHGFGQHRYERDWRGGHGGGEMHRHEGGGDPEMHRHEGGGGGGPAGPNHGGGGGGANHGAKPGGGKEHDHHDH